jgi:hypothetical protein
MHFEINLLGNLEIYLGEGCFRTVWVRVLNRVLAGILFILLRQIEHFVQGDTATEKGPTYSYELRGGAVKAKK